MKISATGSTYRPVNFGRSLTKDETTQAYKVALEARKLMGMEQGNGVLVLPSEKLPDNQDGSAKNVLNKFFASVKNLLGINSVEVTGEIGDDTVKTSVKSALDENGLKRIIKFVPPASDEELAKAAENAAREADGLRVIVDDNFNKDKMGIIEEAFKKVKGEKYNQSLLMYDHGGKAYQWDPDQINPNYHGKVIVGSSNYLNDNGGALWGSTSFYTDRMGAHQGEFIHGVASSSDGINLAGQMANDDQIRQAQNLLETELKLHDDELMEPARFAAAKRADVVMSEHFYKHYDDIIPDINAKISDFEKSYSEALQKGTGDNYFDSLAKAMKALGLNESSPETYETVCKYRNALYASGAKTLEDLASLSAEELQAAYKDTSNVVLQGVEIKKKALEEAAKEAELNAKKAKMLEQYRRNESEILSEGAKMSKAMNPLDVTAFDRFLNFAQKHKKKLAFGGLLVVAAIIGGTMYSYGKEVAEKSQAAKPKPDGFN